MMHRFITASGLALITILGVARFSAPAFGDPGTTAFDAAMKPILHQYMTIQRALAADSTDGVRAAAVAIANAAGKLDPTIVTGEHASHYQSVPADLRIAASALALTPNIEAARETFKDLSKPMAMWGTMSKPDGVDVMFCAKAKASWLQKRGDVRNPYYGKSMLGCGEVVAGSAHGAEPMQHGGHDGEHHMGH